LGLACSKTIWNCISDTCGNTIYFPSSVLTPQSEYKHEKEKASGLFSFTQNAAQILLTKLDARFLKSNVLGFMYEYYIQKIILIYYYNRYLISFVKSINRS
jgi:hypothetical protein